MKEWISRVLGHDKTPEAQLETDAEKMLQEVNALSELTAFTMARADDKHDELTTALARHEALGEQAAELVRAEDEVGARRCLALQLELGDQIRKAQEEYSALQAEAEQKVTQFLERREAVEKKLAELPRLQDDARLTRQQEQIEKQYSVLTTQSAERSFDKTARDIEQKKRELANKNTLLSDPNAALDRRIKHSLREAEIDRAFTALQEKMQLSSPSSSSSSSSSYIEGEIVEGENHDPVQAAKVLLSSPRYKGILPQQQQQKKR